MRYFSIAALHREMVVINDMETFAHYFCYTTRQKKGNVPEVSHAGLPDEQEETGSPALYEIDETVVSDDDEL